jgi:hypothetical protein
MAMMSVQGPLARHVADLRLAAGRTGVDELRQLQDARRDQGLTRGFGGIHTEILSSRPDVSASALG